MTFFYVIPFHIGPYTQSMSMINVASLTMIIANEHWNWMCIQASHPMMGCSPTGVWTAKKCDQCFPQQWTINEVTLFIEMRKRQVYHWFIIDEIILNAFKIIFRWSLKIKGDADTKRINRTYLTTSNNHVRIATNQILYLWR